MAQKKHPKTRIELLNENDKLRKLVEEFQGKVPPKPTFDNTFLPVFDRMENRIDQALKLLKP